MFRVISTKEYKYFRNYSKMNDDVYDNVFHLSYRNYKCIVKILLLTVKMSGIT